jgi:hypothetical protein
MNMPGFTGETSLYKTRNSYRAASVQLALGSGQIVLPQLPRSIGFCMADCDGQYDWGTIDNAVCKFDCMDDGNGGGDGGGGGGGGGPDRTCIQCLNGCNKKPPAQRKACRQACQDDIC